MPPSSLITTIVNMDLYEDICIDLDIPTPDLKIKTSGGDHGRAQLYGTFSPLQNSIVLDLDVTDYSADRLRSANSELVITLLHEMRHAWQYTHHRTESLWLSLPLRETDAEDWARRNLHSYRLLARLVRHQPNSGFSRLSRHAR